MFTLSSDGRRCVCVASKTGRKEFRTAGSFLARTLKCNFMGDMK